MWERSLRAPWGRFHCRIAAANSAYVPLQRNPADAVAAACSIFQGKFSRLPIGNAPRPLWGQRRPQTDYRVPGGQSCREAFTDSFKEMFCLLVVFALWSAASENCWSPMWNASKLFRFGFRWAARNYTECHVVLNCWKSEGEKEYLCFIPALTVRRDFSARFGNERLPPLWWRLLVCRQWLDSLIAD